MKSTWRWLGAATAALMFSAGCGGSDRTGDLPDDAQVSGDATPPATTPPPTTTPPPQTTPPPVVEQPKTPAPWKPKGPESIAFPNTPGWQFFGPQHGGPGEIYDVTTDAYGNIWVAGGEDGLFLLKPGAEKFIRYTLEDGLQPYGYLSEGVPADTKETAYLKVISVERGPKKGNREGTVFVGYHGKPGPRGQNDCEDNWDIYKEKYGYDPDPTIYKSGDADRVELKSDGTLHVVHYDIFAGPGMVEREKHGRERLCHIWRLAYDPGTATIWFGGNHGFARGEANYEFNPGCYPYVNPKNPYVQYNWDWNKCGVEEHTHPIVEGEGGVLLTGRYKGLAVNEATGDVWVGGDEFSTDFQYKTSGENFWSAQDKTEFHKEYQFDFWPAYQDGVSDMTADGSTVWVTSLGNGLARVGAGGAVYDRIGGAQGLIANKQGAVHLNTVERDGDTLWLGYSYLGIVAKLQGGQVTHLGSNTFGSELGKYGIARIKVDNFDGKRVIVGFGAPGNGIYGAAIAIYRPGGTTP